MHEISKNVKKWAARIGDSQHNVLLAVAVGLGLSSGMAIWAFREAIELFHALFVHFLQERLLHSLLGSAAVVLTLALAGALVGAIMDYFIGEERHHGVA